MTLRTRTNPRKLRLGAGLAALGIGCCAVACGDDEGPPANVGGAPGGTSGAGRSSDGGNDSAGAGGSSDGNDSAGGSSDGGNDSAGAGGSSDGNDSAGAGGGAGAANIPIVAEIPSYFSLSGAGCGFISPRNQTFPLFRVIADDREIADGNSFSVEAWSSSGAEFTFTGAITEDTFTLTTTDFKGSSAWAPDGTTVVCTAERGVQEIQEIVCEAEWQAGDPPADNQNTARCTFTPSNEFRASTACLDLPSKFDTVTSTGLELSDCDVVQDGCAFRAFCTESAFQGLVGPDGIFGVTLSTSPALTSCQTTAQDSGVLSGVCNVSDALLIEFNEEAASCEPLLADEGAAHFFALDVSCENAQAAPLVRAQIGDEPSCAFRQRGCNWDLHCVDGEGRKTNLAGTLSPDEESSPFRIALPGGPTGQGFQVPCELAASGGKLAATCAVPVTTGLSTRCSLGEVEAPSAGSAECEDISADLTSFAAISSHGCGNVSAGAQLACKGGFQHGCSFIGECDFGIYLGSYLSGTVSRGPALADISNPAETGARDILSFNGVDGFSCQAQKVLESEVGTYPVRWAAAPDAAGRVNFYTRRVESEWYGTCRSARPHICRGTLSVNNSTPEYQGLRLFFGDRAEIRSSADGPLCGVDANGNGSPCE